ncbi:MAG: hypothetical protein ACPG5M_09560 [Winogradskyella sp.]
MAFICTSVTRGKSKPFFVASVVSDTCKDAPALGVVVPTRL